MRRRMEEKETIFDVIEIERSMKYEHVKRIKIKKSDHRKKGEPKHTCSLYTTQN